MMPYFKKSVVAALAVFAITALVMGVVLSLFPIRWRGDDAEYAAAFISGVRSLPAGAAHFEVYSHPRFTVLTFDVGKDEFISWAKAESREAELIDEQHPQLFRDASSLDEMHPVLNGILVRGNGFKVVFDEAKNRASAERGVD